MYYYANQGSITSIIVSGSSNDILEFRPNPIHGPLLELKRGPKGYTYGCFVKAMDYFLHDKLHSSSDMSRGEGNERQQLDSDGIDDMEEFLNSCNEEINGNNTVDNDFVCMMNLYGENNNDEDDDAFKDVYKSQESDRSDEVHALTGLLTSLENARQGYGFSEEKLKNIIVNDESKKDSSREWYCAVLIQSEIQTLYLYEMATRLVQIKCLTGTVGIDDVTNLKKKQVEELQSQMVEYFGVAAGVMLNQNAVDLTEAYFSIRK